MTHAVWSPLLDLPGPANFLQDHSPERVMAAGLVDGRTWLGLVSPAGLESLLEVPAPLDGQGLRFAGWGREGFFGLCGSTGLWRAEEGSSEVPPVPRDEEGAPAEHLWLTCGDQEIVVVGVFDTGHGKELRVLDAELELLPRENRLYVQGAYADVYVAAFAGRIAVSGRVAPNLATGLSTWWTRSYAAPAYMSESAVPGWQDVQVDPQLDTVTHALDWDAMCFFAGVAAGRPVVWDIEGDCRETPRAHGLDGSSHVFMAEPPVVEDVATLALQRTADTPVLIYQGLQYPMPRGALQAAVLNRGFVAPACFSIVDGTLSTCTLEY